MLSMIIYMLSKSMLIPPQKIVNSEDVEKIVIENGRPLVVRAAIPYWDQENGVESFKKNADLIDTVSLFWYYLGEDGEIHKYEYAEDDQSIIDFAHENGVRVSAVLTNLPEEETWDSDRVEGVLKDEESRRKHINDIKNILNEKKFDGITVDYESVDPSQEQRFTIFIKELSEELGKEEKYVEVALHPQEDFSSRRRYAFQNWKELAKYADRIYVMAYEEHYDEGEPGPPASIPWIEKIIAYAKSQDLPQEKFLFGVPLYGYDWDTGSDEAANGLTYEEVLELMSKEGITPRWNDEYKTSFFEYDDSHEVWYEDVKSFEEKLKVILANNIYGITFWRLGGEDPRVWEILRRIKTS